ncbi:hypothetical protein TNCV_964191 [Trichonephila clavipes]|nr:hypothetical protein TNCV_964191 [Trichonephila clavipes]
MQLAWRRTWLFWELGSRWYKLNAIDGRQHSDSYETDLIRYCIVISFERKQEDKDIPLLFAPGALIEGGEQTGPVSQLM